MTPAGASRASSPGCSPSTSQAGILIALGPGQAILALAPHPGVELRHLLELCLGLATFVVAAVLWFARGRLERHVSGTEARIDRSSLLVGAGITAAELPTAVPYFAVIAAVVGSGRALGTQVGLLFLFNLAFVTPLLGILVVRALARQRGRETIERLRVRVDRYLPVAIPALVLVVAVLLTATGTVGRPDRLGDQDGFARAKRSLTTALPDTATLPAQASARPRNNGAPS